MDSRSCRTATLKAVVTAAGNGWADLLFSEIYHHEYLDTAILVVKHPD
jgi:hypothetical protein